MNRTPDPLAISLEQFHGQMRLSILSKILSLPPSTQATPLLVTAGTIGELIGLITNGDRRLVADCVTELQMSADRVVAMSAEAQAARLESLRQQIDHLARGHKRERRLITLGKAAVTKTDER